MKIFSAAQIKKWDAATINKEPIASIDLMERAAQACFSWLVAAGWQGSSFYIFCGKGNNGGDGLALAHILQQLNLTVKVYILEMGKKGNHKRI